MSRLSFAGLALIVAVFSSLACTPTPTDPDAAPTLTGKTLSGDYWSLTDARGKVVLVNVWATWCEPCRNELPVLAELHRRLGGPDFEVIGVSVDASAAEDEVRDMVERFGLPYLVVLDPNKHVTIDWQVQSYPTSVLLDRRGHVLLRHVGEIRPGNAELERAIAAALEPAT